MEAPMTYGLAAAMLDSVPFTGSTGTTVPKEMLQTAEHDQQFTIKSNIEVAARARAVSPQRSFLAFSLAFSDISTEYATSQQIFDAIQSLHLSTNRPRDRQIAERITALHRDSIAEEERILTDSLSQFTTFFLTNPDLDLPKITLTPDGTLRARWIHGPGNFVAIEFTGEPLVKLVAEIPRDNGLTARHFSSEPVKSILSIARAIGVSFA